MQQRRGDLGGGDISRREATARLRRCGIKGKRHRVGGLQVGGRSGSQGSLGPTPPTTHPHARAGNSQSSLLALRVGTARPECHSLPCVCIRNTATMVNGQSASTGLGDIIIAAPALVSIGPGTQGIGMHNLSFGGDTKSFMRQGKQRHKGETVNGDFREHIGDEETPSPSQSNSSMEIPTSSHIHVNEDSTNSLQVHNLDDLLEEREYEVRNKGNWIDGEGEEFLRNYHNLLQLKEGCLNLGREDLPFI